MTLQDFIDSLPPGPRKPNGDGFMVRCPAHPDKTPSLSVSTGDDGRLLLKCFGGCTADAIVGAIGMNLKDLMNGSPTDQPKPRSQPAAPVRPEINWQGYLDRFNADVSAAIAKKRGYTQAFVDTLHRAGHIGATADYDVAFPIHVGGRVVAAHTYDYTETEKNKAWRVVPGGSQTLWRIGDSEAALIIFESQWDAFAFMQLTGWLTTPGLQEAMSIWIVRGASNAKLLANQIRTGARPKIYVFEQRDSRPTPDKLSPAEALTSSIATTLARRIHVWRSPAGIKDLNDWLREGAAPDTVATACEQATLYRDPTKPYVEPESFDSLMAFDAKNDPTTLLGDRYLCRGGSCLIVGGSGIGKSVLTVQAGIELRTQKRLLSIPGRDSYRSVIVQAEDDTGDMAEMFQGVCRHHGITKDSPLWDQLKDGVFIHRVTNEIGEKFVQTCHDLVIQHEADFLFINPLNAYFDGDINHSKDVVRFCNLLNHLAHSTGVCIFLVHHTPKPSKETPKPTSLLDLSYAGLGSSQWTNWARAVMIFRTVPDRDDVVSLTFTKRGKRTGIRDDDYQRVNKIYLQHSEHGLAWIPSDYSPETDTDTPPTKPGRKAVFTFEDFLTRSTWNRLPIRRLDLRHLVEAAFQTGRSSANTCLDRWIGTHIVLDTSAPHPDTYKIP